MRDKNLTVEATCEGGYRCTVATRQFRIRIDEPEKAGGEEFAAFDRAGYAKMAANFRLAPTAGGGAVRLSTETRVACTDASSARRFARYWRLVRPASGAIRRSWLAAIKRRAKRRPDSEVHPEVPAR